MKVWGQVIEIGGEDIVTYKDMMLGYAKVRRLKRFIITVPVLTPRLSSYWIHFVTPVSKTIAKPLIDGLKNEVVVTNNISKRIFPEIKPMNYKMALKNTLKKLESGHTPTSWRDALSSSLQDGKKNVALASLEGIIIEKRATVINASESLVYDNFITLGGGRGWLLLQLVMAGSWCCRSNYLVVSGCVEVAEIQLIYVLGMLLIFGELRI